MLSPDTTTGAFGSTTLSALGSMNACAHCSKFIGAAKGILKLPMFGLQNYEIIQEGHREKEHDDAGTKIDDDPSEFEVVVDIAAVADTYTRSRSRSAKKKDMFHV